MRLIMPCYVVLLVSSVILCATPGSGMSVCAGDHNVTRPYLMLEWHNQRPLRTNHIRLDHYRKHRKTVGVPQQHGPLLVVPANSRHSLDSPMGSYPLPDGKRECAICRSYVAAQQSRRFAICYRCYHALSNK